MRANVVPGLVLQGFALLIVLGYFGSEAVGEALDGVGLLKQRWGFLFSLVSTALFGGLIPFVVLWRRGRLSSGHPLGELVFYLSFWAIKGVEVDLLYRFQAWMFGGAPTFAVIVPKVLFDQFVYNPLWGAPSQTWAFAFKDSGFSLEETRRQLRRHSLVDRCLVVLFSTWVVWIPAVAIVYALPGPLQLPLFNLVLCFWCLLLSFVSREQ
jgi:hypothetical protein